MTIEQALNQLFDSKEFSEENKKDKGLNVLKGRFKKDQLGTGSSVDLLKRFGYEIVVIEKKRSHSKH